MKKNIKFLIIVPIIVLVIIIIIMIAKVNNKIVVCIDAGHGGEDVGAVLEKRYEKDDNLKVAKLVKEYLRKKDIKVVMTRKKDNTVSLEERCNIANKKNAEIFVSIHRNSAETGNGIEIWCNSQKREEDTELANSIMTKLQETEIQKDRGIKYGTISGGNSDYYVLKNTNMSSCLIELGFITDEKDNELLDNNIEEYAKAIANGIVEIIQSKNS